MTRASRTPHAPHEGPPELLLPAGSTEALYAAIEGGADAVYLGLDRFSARGRAKNFSHKAFPAACHLAHEKGVKVYLTLNTLIKNGELPELIGLIALAAASGADAIIVQDWGVFYIIKKYFPDIPVHASTQMAVHNSIGARMAARLGFARAVLARELMLPEIAAIAREKAVALEVFAHGALCYSLSGHCLMSSWIGGMSANRGFCRQPCRRSYALGTGDGTDWGESAGEGESPFFNLRDLELIDYVSALQKAGARSLKIEGRMKPAEYVYITARAYRQVLDNPRTVHEAK
jgi:putative protease